MDTDLAPYERDAAAFLERLASAVERGGMGVRDCEAFFEEMLAIAEAPAPDAAVLAWFYAPAVLRELADGLFVRFSWRLREAVDTVGIPYSERQKGTSIRVRRLGPVGTYPNLDLDTPRGAYRLHAGLPYLITTNAWPQERRWSPYSELSSLTRHEVRIAAALTCGERGAYSPYLSDTLHDIPLEVLAHIEPDERFRFAIECLSLLERLRRDSVHDVRVARGSPARALEFWDFRDRRPAVRLFASRFSVSDPLLLRTAKYLVRSAMLESVEGLEEDAFTSLLFALEGCILMLQRMHGASTDRIKRRFLKKALMDTFPHGAVDYDYIEEAMGWGGVRASLVHPQLADQEGWTSQRMAGEFFEYRRLVRSFLRYLVTGEKADWFDPLP